MKNTTLKMLSMLLLLNIQFSQAQTNNSPQQFSFNENAPYKQGIIVFKLLKGIDVSNAKLTSALNQIGASDIKKIFPHNTPPLELTDKLGKPMVDLTLIYRCNFKTPDIKKAIQALMKTGVVQYAEPEYLHFINYTPNDPSLGLQYHLGKINAYLAWDTQKGDTNVVIGITDTGTDWDHPDLVNSIKYNYNDPIDGTDNDNDGYIDNFRGWDISENDNNPMVDNSDHGSHVSGCSSATTDNNIGVAGSGFNCKFIMVKCSKQASTNAIDNGYEAITYAADHGCSIINCSWGGAGGSQFGQDACNYATINKGCLVVASAGNNGNDILSFPAAYNNVLCVASTGNNDVKSSFSNYGYWVDVCAPGSNIYATLYNNGYAFLSGTSMSSPVCAGGAALVKSQYPSYSGLQVGEKLRVTCDNIYGIGGNSPYPNKLGNGRINLASALTASSPSVRFENVNYYDNNDNTFIIGDTIRMQGVFRNYLDATTALNITLSSTSPYVQILNNTVNAGVMNTLDSLNITSNPFTFLVKANAPKNTSIPLKITYADPNYNAAEYFSITVNVDYINITVNRVFTTVTSRGKIGYNQDSQTEGLGFVYNDSLPLMYESGLMIGKNSTTVSDVFRGTGAAADEDFFALVSATKLPNVKSDFDVYAKFNDNPGSPQIKVDVTHRSYAWVNAGDDKYVIMEYVLKNTGTSTLSNLYAGIATDWDIQDFSHNKGAEETALKMGYVYCTDAGGVFAGAKLLTNTGFNHYSIDNISGGGGGVDLYASGFSTAEKYTTVSTARPTAGGTGVGNDIIDVVSSGPLTIAAGDSVKIAFALLAGDELSDLIVSANNAQIKYDGILSSGIANASSLSTNMVLFPNPANNFINIVCKDALNENVVIEIIDINGRVCITTMATNNTVIDTSVLTNGIYTVRAKGNNYFAQQQLTIVKN